MEEINHNQILYPSVLLLIINPDHPDHKIHIRRCGTRALDVKWDTEPRHAWMRAENKELLECYCCHNPSKRGYMRENVGPIDNAKININA